MPLEFLLVVTGNGIKGVRGPHGGYALAREQKRITAEDVLRAAGSSDDGAMPLPVSSLVNDVVRPALGEAERSFSAALRRLTIEDLARAAEKQK